MPNSRQRVLVINSGSVFDTSMLQLLEQASDLEVAEVAFEGDSEFVATVALFRPNTVVVNDSEEADASHILQLLKQLQMPDRLRVLVVRMDANTIDQYEIKQVVMAESADLAALIRNE